MKRLLLYCITGCIIVWTSCSPKSEASSGGEAEEAESSEAKSLLQGIWVDDDTEEISFRAIGDTIYYPDTISQSTAFKIVKDSLVLGDVGAKYPIVKQSAHVFWFKNQNGDVVKLAKSDDPVHVFAFVHDKPEVMTYTQVVKTDSVGDWKAPFHIYARLPNSNIFQ